MNARIQTFAVFVGSVTTVLAMAQGRQYKVITEVPTVGWRVTEVNLKPDDGFVVGLAGNHASEVRGFDRDGVQRWSKGFTGELLSVKPGRSRIHALTIEGDPSSPDSSGQLHLDVIDGSTGSTVRRFRANSDMNMLMSFEGDAVAFYENPFENPQPQVTVRKVDGGDSRVINLDRPVSSAVALDYQRLVVLLNNGRLDYFNGNTRRWSVQVTKEPVGDEALDVSVDAMLGLVRLSGGAFAVFDLVDGSPVYRYSPTNPDQALASLGLMGRAMRNVGGDSRAALSRLASNLHATLLPSGEVSIIGKEVDDIEVRLNARTGHASMSPYLEDLKRGLSALGERSAIALGRNQKGRPAAISSRGFAIVAGERSLLVLSPAK